MCEHSEAPPGGEHGAFHGALQEGDDQPHGR